MSNPSLSTAPVLHCAGRRLDLSTPVVMGVLNTTPDSFSDGGTLYGEQGLDLCRAMRSARAMVERGARILDIGGESTRPGAAAVSLDQEIDRVVPLVEKISQELDVVVSVDTSSPEVMTAAAAVGAGLINDVRALTREGALAAAAATDLPICLMHMQGRPATMQQAPQYDDVLATVVAYLEERVRACEQVGIAPRRLILDPGFGFGKSVDHNLHLLQNLSRLVDLGYPILVGLSRKSLIGALIGRPVDQRMPASLALALLAVERGAAIVRTHDVAETVDAIAMASAVAKVRI